MSRSARNGSTFEPLLCSSQECMNEMRRSSFLKSGFFLCCSRREKSLVSPSHREHFYSFHGLSIQLWNDLQYPV